MFVAHPSRGLREAEEAELPHGLQQRLLVAKMPVGRRVADARTACRVCHREAQGAAFLNQFGGRDDQGVAQIAVVIGFGCCGHAASRCSRSPEATEGAGAAAAMRWCRRR